MSDPNLSKKDRRDAARAERQAAEQAATASAARKRRLSILGGLVGAAAAVIVAVALATSGGGDDDEPAAPAPTSAAVAGAAESSEMLTGVAQSGNTLGDPKAPVTLVEFADLQCPFCRDYAVQTLPRVIQDYVRTGKVKLELRLLTFLGPDSVRGSQVAARAGEQNKLWNFVDLFYRNQGEEQTGYGTDAFLKKLTAGVSGLDSAKVFASPVTETATEADKEADSLAAANGVTGTPAILIGKSGGPLKAVDGLTFDDSGADYDRVKAALDAALTGS
ncbi:hypothetical protein DSM112329_00431 [Paraconexibacter sp. AEG42_29]|uniref:Thioredoxin domain-containing protein n=1 Tax=Paraconexibacter sp. AEG42_29 TaxID=2997339 RepID=A0AAU7APP7_9ACTN